MFNELDYQRKAFFAQATYAAFFQARANFPEIEALADDMKIQVLAGGEIARTGNQAPGSPQLDVLVMLHFSRLDTARILPKYRGDALLAELFNLIAVAYNSQEDGKALMMNFNIACSFPGVSY